jgi:hypothetical protein
MRTVVLLVLNLSLVVLFTHLLRRPGLLSFYQRGRWWLTWLGIAIITLMDEFTSVFYAPAEVSRSYDVKRE